MTMESVLFVLHTSSSARRLYLKTARKLRMLKLEAGARPGGNVPTPAVPAAPVPAAEPAPSRLEYRPGGMWEACARSAIARLIWARGRGIQRLGHRASTLVVGARDQPRAAPEEHVPVNPRHQHRNPIAEADEHR